MKVFQWDALANGCSCLVYVASESWGDAKRRAKALNIAVPKTPALSSDKEAMSKALARPDKVLVYDSECQRWFEAHPRAYKSLDQRPSRHCPDAS